MPNRLVVAGAVATGVLGVVVALVALFPPVRQVPGPRAGLVVAGVVAVLGVCMLVLLHRATAGRWAAWFAVPAAALGAVWWWQPQSSFGWFAYAPLPRWWSRAHRAPTSCCRHSCSCSAHWRRRA